jgi:RNA recognition motif-containing protein
MNIYVGNLSLDVSEEDLKKEFSPYGEVTSVIMMNDRYIGSGQTRGYGYVVMPSHSEGMEAVYRLQGKIFKNRPIQVIEALPLSSIENEQNRVIADKRINKKPRQRLYR